MSIRIETNHPAKPIVSFPKLMHDPDAGLLLLMACDSNGVVIKPGTTRYSVGHHGTNWMMHRLVDYYGKVVLENI